MFLCVLWPLKFGVFFDCLCFFWCSFCRLVLLQGAAARCFEKPGRFRVNTQFLVGKK